jgi:pimeloyl-ACP methyl ester carboxylesterase
VRFFLPDLRGFGKSSHAPLRQACPLTTYAEDIEDLCDHFGLRSLALGGISMGAFTAVQSFKLFGGARYSRYLHVDQGPVIRNSEGYSHGLLGPRQPEFFARMATLIDALEQVLASAQTGAAMSPAAAALSLAYEDLPAELRAELVAVFGQFMMAAFGTPALRGLMRRLVRWDALVRSMLPQAALATHLQIMRAYLEQDYDLRAAFRRIAVPTTVLIGGASRMYPAAGQRAIGQLVPHSVVRELDGVGHALPIEAPLRFVRELKEFLPAA